MIDSVNCTQATVSNPLGWDGDRGFEAADQYFNTIFNVAVDES